MKVLLAVFAMCVVSYKGVNANPNYSKLATILQVNIGDLIADLDKVDDKVEETITHLNDIANSINFGLSRNAQLMQLQESIKAHQYSEGIKSCVNLLDTKALVVLNELKGTLKNLINEQLNLNKIDILDIRTELGNISESLVGISLDNEIQYCKKYPKNCRITIDYPNAVTKDTERVNNIEVVTDRVVNSILVSVVLPSVPGKVNSEIYIPVDKCISHLT